MKSVIFALQQFYCNYLACTLDLLYSQINLQSAEKHKSDHKERINQKDIWYCILCPTLANVPEMVQEHNSQV